jgi:hypothetical protein
MGWAYVLYFMLRTVRVFRIIASTKQDFHQALRKWWTFSSPRDWLVCIYYAVGYAICITALGGANKGRY